VIESFGMKKFDFLWYFLNSFYIFLNLVVVGEVKPYENLKKDHSRGQIGTYMHRIIKASPNRSFCYSFLTDCNTIAFVKTSFSETKGYIYEMTDFMDFSKQGGINLLSLLQTNPSTLGWSLPILQSSSKTYDISCQIGKGLTSQVWQSSNFVVKRILPKYQAELKNEMMILELLEKNKIERVPKLVDSGVDILVIEPCGETFLNFTRESIAIHQVGLVHRDIRPSNLIQVKTDVYLIDWGYACNIGEKVNFIGKLIYASLDILNEPEFPLIKTHASQDLHMLLKMIYIHFVNSKALPDEMNRTEIKAFWETDCPNFLKIGFKLCTDLNYTGLIQFIFQDLTFVLC